MCGGGVNAPERPRRDDVRRYCLDCSRTSGRLVERSAPALDRRRERADALRSDRAAAKRARERAKWLVETEDAAGRCQTIDVRTELRRALTECGYFKGWAPGQCPKFDEVDVTIRRGSGEGSTGRATGCMRVVFTFGSGYEAAMELIYHEAAHLALPEGEHHGPRFRRTLADALQARWPFVRYGSVRRGAVYDADRAVVEQLRTHVLAGGVL